MSMLNLLQETCTICGQDVNNTAGHFVNVATQPNGSEGEVVLVAEFHCLECDPIDPNAPVLEAPQYDSGG